MSMTENESRKGVESPAALRSSHKEGPPNQLGGCCTSREKSNVVSNTGYTSNLGTVSGRLEGCATRLLMQDVRRQ
jgi:hypothetical protein